MSTNQSLAQALTAPITQTTAYVDLKHIQHNYRVLQTFAAQGQSPTSQTSFTAHGLPPHFGTTANTTFVWPAQMAVTKADAYGHGHIETALALMQVGATAFVSGSIQEACALRQGIDAALSTDAHAVQNKALIISLLGSIVQEDLDLCVQYGIVPLIHCKEHLNMLAQVHQTLPIVVKCNTGMARLGFNEDAICAIAQGLQTLPHIVPILALSHMHSADTADAIQEIHTQGACFMRMVRALRTYYPHMAASLANSAGVLFADTVLQDIGNHVCRSGVALYGINPFTATPLACVIEKFAQNLLPTMWVSAPIIATRTLNTGDGIGYGHIFTATKPTQVAIIACGYADGFSRGLTQCATVCIAGTCVPLIGRIAMQMCFADISALPTEALDMSQSPRAWLMGGPYAATVSANALAKAWDTIPYEVFCLLGKNTRQYVNF